MISENKNDWFVLYTKPRQELKVLNNLNQLGIEAYTPTEQQIRQWSDRKKKVEISLLPSMVLVKLNEKEVDKVFEVYGTKGYLFFNGKRAVVYDHEVEAMKDYLGNKFLEKQSSIAIGNNIEIASLKQQAKILEVNGKNCIVRLQMLGATMSLKLN